MKKILILLGVSLFVCTLLANDIMQPAQIAKGDYYQGMRFGHRSAFRDQNPAPEYSFIPNGDGENTTYLTSSYYDYMPFSYNGHNLRAQPETSFPYGFPADGMFVTYMRSATQAVGTDRRAYYSYLNPDGTLYNSYASNVYTIEREGFTSLAIDPYTGNPFTVWHSVVEPDNSYDCSIAYELYHASGSSSNWIQPFILFDNPEMSQPFTGATNDEFIWPQVWVGPSPLADHRRVHAYGNNYTSNSSGGINYNSLYMYADFDADSLLYSSHLYWTVKTLLYFDYMHYNDIARVNKDMIVSETDGKVVFFGSVADSLFALYSDDYGETFTKYSQQLKQSMDNPTNIITGAPLWENDDGSPAEMFILPSNDLTHYNGVFTDNNTKVQWMTGVNYNSTENIDQSQYWPSYIYPKIFTFDTVTEEFRFYDLDVQDSDPGDDHLAVAFDLDDDGLVDEYDDDGWPIVVMSSPSWFFNSEGGWQDAYFHESNCKMASNDNWVVCVWHDGAKLQNAFYEEPGYEGWVEQPEIAIIISDNGGATWSDIRYINANPNDNIIDPVNHYDGNYAPELAGMLPVNVSLGYDFEILSNVPGNYHAKLNFVFMDDGDYGSAAGPCVNSGNLTNSALCYAAIDLDFGNPVNAEFTADVLTGEPPLTVNFTDLSSGDIISWEWDFQNDGIIDSYMQDPTYIYTQDGIYTVSLTVSSSTNSDNETKVDYITVGDPLIADFEADPLTGLSPLNVQFTDLSSGGVDFILNHDKNVNRFSKAVNEKMIVTDNSRDIISWEWDFDNDGTIDSYEQNPAYTYSEAGIYTVSLTVSDGTNTDTEIKVGYINVGEALTANFEADVTTGEIPLEVQFTDLSSGGLDLFLNEDKNAIRSSKAGNEKKSETDNSRDIISWEWDFQNDGIIDSYLQNPIHTYNEGGFYTVSLTVSDGTNEDTEIKEDYIIVGNPIIADFEADVTSGETPLEVQFTDLSTGQIIGWMWDFDYDGTIDSNEQNPIYIYSEEGIYTVSLTVSDGTYEDTEIKVDYITVNPVSGDIGLLPINTQLYPNHPNPFNPLTTISFDIKENETGILTIFNIKGQLIESNRFESGKHNYLWDASEQSSGIYLYKLHTETITETRKMLLLK